MPRIPSGVFRLPCPTGGTISITGSTTRAVALRWCKMRINWRNDYNRGDNTQVFNDYWRKRAALQGPSVSASFGLPFNPGSLLGGGGGGGGFGLPPAPATPAELGGGGGGFGGGGLVGAACAFVPVRLRPLCEAAGGALTGGGGGGGGSGLAPAQCPEGQIRVGGRCVDLGAALPGGDPFVSTAGGVATQGAFGMPAITPTQEQRVHRKCPEGMVLGKDNLCYPKAVLSRRSKFRKWRQPRRPLFTAGDMNAIRRAERLKKKAKKIGKDLGFKVTNR